MLWDKRGATMDEFKIKNNTLTEYTGNMERIVIPSGVTKIESYFCREPDKVKELVLPESLLEIGDCNFCDYTQLESICIPQSVQRIGKCAFSGCSNLRKVIMMRNDVEIDKFAFSRTRWEIEMLKQNGAFVVGQYLIEASPELTEYTIPAQVKIICRDAFRNSALKSIEIPEGIEEIEICAFMDSALENVTLPSSLKRIGGYAFSNCKNLEEITIPKSVEFMDSSAFCGLPNCTLTFLDDDEDGCFDYFGTYKEKEKYVKSVRAPFGSAPMRAALSCGIPYEALPGTPKKYKYIDNVFCCLGPTLYKYLGHEENVIVPEGIDQIENNAFSTCEMKHLILPDDVTYLQSFAIASCPKLESVYGNGVMIVDENAFYHCELLERVEFPNLVEYDDIAFAGCNKLDPENMLFPESATVFKHRPRFCGCGHVNLVPDGKIHCGATNIIEV